MTNQITIGITKKPSTGEYRVFWKEGNKDIESRAYYTDDPLDAVNTLQSIQDRHPEANISSAKFTNNLITKYFGSDKEVPYDMSDRQAMELAEEERECRETPHRRQQRLYGVG